MNRKKYLFVTGVAVFLIVAVLFLVFIFPHEEEKITNFDQCVEAGYPVLESYPRQCQLPDGEILMEDIGNQLEKMNLIQVHQPTANEWVASPMYVGGEARGYWFFEASFPIRIVDASGRELGRGIAQALGEWMTEEFVRFEAEIEFEKPTTLKGVLMLEKDNPSGLPENADELYIPVRFSDL